MGYRLSKIYTKTGDDGTTGLGTTQRIGKDSDRIAAIGDIDELNCCIGLLLEALPAESRHNAYLRQVQHDLFDLGGELAMPEYKLLDELILTQLEEQIDKLNEALAPLRNFILPGGNEMAARAHLARSVCRRGERTLVRFNQAEDHPHLLAQQYLNRLSDFLFVLARTLVHDHQDAEILWQSRHRPSE